MIKHRFDVYLNTHHFPGEHIADCVIAEEGSVVSAVAVRYRVQYLDNPHAFALDPVSLPLKAGEITFSCRGGLPGILDDYLPDDWGKKVLAQLVLYRHKQRLNSNSTIQVLQHLGNSRIGALLFVPIDVKPEFTLGCDISRLAMAEHAASQIDNVSINNIQIDELSLLHLANSGTGVGGARPKALIHEQGKAYLAKFNRHRLDEYNNARIELACLHMADAAGIDVHTGFIREGINAREVLMLERFDVNRDGTRNHLITVNALLKEPGSQRDMGEVFSYTAIAKVLKAHSCQIETDLKQLVRQMLFNRAINNTDDHERNFSLIHTGAGYRLSPAYDMVPSLSHGQYHAAGYNYSPYPPKPSEVAGLGKIFGLSKPVCLRIADEVTAAIHEWPKYAQACGVSEGDMVKVGEVVKH